jgi:hypothetical protein
VSPKVRQAVRESDEILRVGPYQNDGKVRCRQQRVEHRSRPVPPGIDEQINARASEQRGKVLAGAVPQSDCPGRGVGPKKYRNPAG